MKMSNIHMELEELAQKKGFESLSEALQAGCEAKYDEDTVELLDPLEAAHRAWEKEKKEALNAIDHLKGAIEYLYEGEEFNPETAAVSLDGNINMPLRYSDVLKIKKFIEEARF